MIHSDRATSTAPPRGGAKPPPGRPPTDGAKKGQHGPASHGKDGHGPGAHGKDAPGKKGGPPPQTGPRPMIKDDLPEEEAPAKAPGWSFKLPAAAMPSAKTLRRAALIAVAVLLLAAAAYGTMKMIRHNMELARLDRIETAIATALDDHARKHHGEGRSFEEISFTDYIRHCLGATVTAADYVTAHGLDAAAGPALLAEAEGGCLRAKVMEILSMPKRGEVPDADELKAKEIRVRTFLVFAREHGYQFPPDLMAYEHASSPAGSRP